MAVIGRVGARHAEDHARFVAVRYPRLRATQEPVIAIAHGLTAQGGGIGTGLRLRQGEGAKPFTTRHRRQEALLLRLGAEVQNHLRGQRVVYAEQYRRRGVADGDLLERKQIALRVEIESIEAFRREHTEKAHLGHLRDHHAVEARCLIALTGKGHELTLGVRARHRLDFLLRVVELNKRHDGSVLVEATARLASVPASGDVLPE